MPQSNQAHVPQVLSPSVGAQELQLLSPGVPEPTSTREATTGSSLSSTVKSPRLLRSTQLETEAPRAAKRLSAAKTKPQTSMLCSLENKPGQASGSPPMASAMHIKKPRTLFKWGRG